MTTFRSYKNALVSAVDHDFSTRSHREVPGELLADWVELMVALTTIQNPGFTARAPRDTDAFTTTTIHSDGPYGASEDFYELSYAFLDLVDAAGVGVRVCFEEGRREGGEPLVLETRGVQPAFSSFIPRAERLPRASVHAFLDDVQAQRASALIAEHAERCRARRPAR